MIGDFWGLYAHHNTENVHSKVKESQETYTQRKEQTYKIFMRKPKGKRLLGRERCRWENKIKVDVNRMRDYGSRQDYLVDCSEYGDEISRSMKYCEKFN